MTILPVLLGIFGLMIGSFLNVCISRLPAGESIVSPPSRCPKCGKPIAWHDNIPVLSFVMLAGKCRNCGTPIGIKYPAVEVTTSLCFFAQGVFFGDDLPLLGARLLFTALLIVLFGTDLETMRLPNVITYPGIVAGLMLSVALPPGIVGSVIGAALGAAIPWTIRWVWYRVKGVEAMGLGDVKMLAMIGAFLGWQQVWVVLFLGESHWRGRGPRDPAPGRSVARQPTAFRHIPRRGGLPRVAVRRFPRALVHRPVPALIFGESHR